MITIEANEIKYRLPDSWLEMKLGQLIAISNIDPLLNEIDQTVETIFILCGMPKEVQLAIHYQDYSKLHQALSYISSEIPDDLFKVWSYDGIDYQFNCNLETMTTAEYLDLDKLLKNWSMNNLDKLMSILYRPKDEVYDWRITNKRIEIFNKNMPASVAVAAQVFSSVLEQNFLKHIQDSSTEV